MLRELQPGPGTGAARTRSLRSAQPSTDARVRYARAALLGAVQDLASTDSRISVASICQHAGIGRSTFYTHFAGLGELSAALLADAVSAVAAADIGASDDHEDTVRERVRRLVRHYRQLRPLYRAAFDLPAPRAVHEAATAAVASTTVTYIESLPWRAPVPRVDIVARGIAAMITGLLADWTVGAFEANEDVVTETIVAALPPWMMTAPDRP